MNINTDLNWYSDLNYLEQTYILPKYMFIYLCYRCTDINPSAVKVTMETAKRNCICVQPIITDLVNYNCFSFL